MTIQEEIHNALNEIQRKVSNGQDLSESEMQILFLSSLIEEESTL